MKYRQFIVPSTGATLTLWASGELHYLPDGASMDETEVCNLVGEFEYEDPTIDLEGIASTMELHAQLVRARNNARVLMEHMKPESRVKIWQRLADQCDQAILRAEAEREPPDGETRTLTDGRIVSAQTFGTVWGAEHIRPMSDFDLGDPEQYEAFMSADNLRQVIFEEEEE